MVTTGILGILRLALSRYAPARSLKMTTRESVPEDLAMARVSVSHLSSHVPIGPLSRTFTCVPAGPDHALHPFVILSDSEGA